MRRPRENASRQSLFAFLPAPEQGRQPVYFTPTGMWSPTIRWGDMLPNWPRSPGEIMSDRFQVIVLDEKQAAEARKELFTLIMKN